MHGVDVKDIPPAYAKRAMKHGMIPATFIAMIGVGLSRHGKSISSALVADALSRIARASQDIGTCIIVLDALDVGDVDAVARRKPHYTTLHYTTKVLGSRRC